MVGLIFIVSRVEGDGEEERMLTACLKRSLMTAFYDELIAHADYSTCELFGDGNAVPHAPLQAMTGETWYLVLFARSQFVFFANERRQVA